MGRVRAGGRGRGRGVGDGRAVGQCRAALRGFPIYQGALEPGIVELQHRTMQGGSATVPPHDEAVFGGRGHEGSRDVCPFRGDARDVAV